MPDYTIQHDHPASRDVSRSCRSCWLDRRDRSGWDACRPKKWGLQRSIDAIPRHGMPIPWLYRSRHIGRIPAARAELRGTGSRSRPGSSSSLSRLLDELYDACVYGAIVSINITVSHIMANVDSNGTAENCLPSVLATSPVANTNTFFNNLASGHELAQYADSVFKTAQCTGCMYEMYKAAYVP
jgi:hypothetical protein